MDPNPGTRILRLNSDERQAIWEQAIASIESFFAQTDSLPVYPQIKKEALTQSLERWDFASARPPKEAIDYAVRGLTEAQLQTSHAAYFGVFNPTPATMGIVGDLLTAAFNPQLASWTSSPFCIELESHLVRVLALKGIGSLGWEGNFTSGGAEANHSALLLALCAHFPDWEEKGITQEPTIYVSTQSHHSFLKSARVSGLGSRSVREVAVGPSLRMDMEALQARVTQDRSQGKKPFFVVATAGTTGAGTIDDIGAMAQFAKREGLWLHVDGAWGGAALLVPELRGLFEGVENADSLTMDAHKWLNIPMGAGILMTRHPHLRRRVFHVQAHYMPADSQTDTKPQPYQETLQWSRRCMGLKVFLTLATVGWEGVAEVIRHQVAMGQSLRAKLEDKGWKIEHTGILPVVCFTDSTRPDGGSEKYHEAVVKAVADSGDSWLTTAKLSAGQSVLRAGIASYRTDQTHLDILVRALQAARVSLA